MLILVVFDVKQVWFQTGSVIRFAESKFSKEAASAVRTRLVVIGQTWEGEGRRVCGVLGVECEICVLSNLLMRFGWIGTNNAPTTQPCKNLADQWR